MKTHEDCSSSFLRTEALVKELQSLSQRNLSSHGTGRWFSLPSRTFTSYIIIHAYTSMCIYLQWGAGTARLHGNAPCPWWKEEDEARGGVEAAEGFRGWRGSTVQRGRQRRRGLDRTDGGPGWCVRTSGCHIQTTSTYETSFSQTTQQHQQQYQHHTQTSTTLLLLTCHYLWLKHFIKLVASLVASRSKSYFGQIIISA